MKTLRRSFTRTGFRVASGIAGITAAVLLLLVLSSQASPSAGGTVPQPRAPAGETRQASKLERAVFAGGCFWSLETAFEKRYGVIQAVSGYTGGKTMRPTYDNYVSGGHVEAVQVYYDPSRTSYADLLDVYWRSVDPTDGGGSFYDRGPGYRPVIYYMNAAQKTAAESSRDALGASGMFRKPLAVEIRLASVFYPAEEYHQDYAKKNPDAYARYRVGSGRDAFFSSVWGAAALADAGRPPSASGMPCTKPSGERLRATLTPLQFEVTQQDGTEPAFDNELWNTKGKGIYVDIVSGEPLFSSRDKYDSGTGWPSFTQPLVPGNVLVRIDRTYGMVREEVRSRYADSHLGHVFDDGPAPTGRRYCINSVRFVPVERMEAEGYASFIPYLD